MKLISGYIYIPVSNFDKAAKWYNEILGFEIIFTDPLYYGLRSPSGIHIMLIERRGGINSHMIYHDTGEQAVYGFIVNDAEAARAELVSKNVDVRRLSKYQGKSFGFYDLDGNIIELWEEPK